MNWFLKLFKINLERVSFAKVDWQSIESRWQAVLTMSQQLDQTHAKQAILQADILIDSIMKTSGVSGNSFAERLRNIQSRFSPSTYQALWRAHKKRNELVHEAGSHIESWEKQEYLKGYERALKEMRGWR